MPKPLRARVARPLEPETVKRKLAGEDKVDEEVMRLTAQTLEDADTEAKLARLQVIAQIENDAKKEREALRDELTPLLEDGPRIFVGKDGRKYFGYNVQQENTIVDVDLLRQLVSPELYAEVVKDAVDLKKFRIACSAKRIPDDVIVKVTTFRSKTPYVNFGVGSQ